MKYSRTRLMTFATSRLRKRNRRSPDFHCAQFTKQPNLQWHHLSCRAYGGQPFKLPPGFSHAADAFFHDSSNQPHRHRDAPPLSLRPPPAVASSASCNPRELTPRSRRPNRRRRWVSWRTICPRGQRPRRKIIMPRRASSPRRAPRVWPTGCWAALPVSLAL